MQKNLIDEENALEEIKKKNEEALRYLIGQYGSLVMSIVGKHLYLLKEEKQECFDDVFLNVWEHIESFDEKRGSFANWIAGIARYKSIDYLRRYRKRLEEVPLDDTIADKSNALLGLIEEEISEETEAVLSYLKPEERELFEKLFVEEMTMDEVCDSMKTGPDVIYKRVSRARKRMRKRFPERAV